jgi:hypothetical protein
VGPLSRDVRAGLAISICRQYRGGRSVPDGRPRFASHGREWSLTGLWLNCILVVGVVGGVVGRVVLTALAHWTHCRRNNRAPDPEDLQARMREKPADETVLAIPKRQLGGVCVSTRRNTARIRTRACAAQSLFGTLHNLIVVFLRLSCWRGFGANGWRFFVRPLNAFDTAVILVWALPIAGVDASLLQLARMPVGGSASLRLAGDRGSQISYAVWHQVTQCGIRKYRWPPVQFLVIRRIAW